MPEEVSGNVPEETHKEFIHLDQPDDVNADWLRNKPGYREGELAAIAQAALEIEQEEQAELDKQTGDSP